MVPYMLLMCKAIYLSDLPEQQAGPDPFTAPPRNNPTAPKAAPVLVLRQAHALRPLPPKLVCITRARRTAARTTGENTMQLINDTLAELALAAPQGYANLAVYLESLA